MILGFKTLTDVLNEEQAAVAAGQAKACGADHHGQADGVLCMRKSTHEDDGEQAREAHANHVEDDTANFWFTWQNQEATVTP